MAAYPRGFHLCVVVTRAHQGGFVEVSLILVERRNVAHAVQVIKNIALRLESNCLCIPHILYIINPFIYLRVAIFLAFAEAR